MLPVSVFIFNFATSGSSLQRWRSDVCSSHFLVASVFASRQESILTLAVRVESESFRLEKNSEIVEFNLWPITTLSTKSQHWVPHWVVSWALLERNFFLMNKLIFDVLVSLLPRTKLTFSWNYVLHSKHCFPRGHGELKSFLHPFLHKWG